MTADGTGDERVGQAASAFTLGPVEVGDAGEDGVGESERYAPTGEATMNGPFHDVIMRDRVVRRRVLVREVSHDLAESANEQRRFARAARLQAQLEHPAILPVYDIATEPFGTESMVLPELRGVSLRRVLDARAGGDRDISKKFSRTALLQGFLQLCLATAYAHAKGVVLRNIHPGGIVLGDHGEVYLSDFGAAKAVEGADAPALSTSFATDASGMGLPEKPLGTPGYAAPEQLAGGDADARSDVYALGALLFEILTDSPLHSGATAVDKIRSTQVGLTACPSQRAPNAGIPEGFDTICVRATAMDPKLRFSSALELHDAVDQTLEEALEAGRRTELASRHAELAESLAMRALTATTGHYDFRAQALREAGRAFALDPKSPGARRALLALLKDAPPDLPPEAKAELDADAAEQARAVGRFAMGAYGAFGLILVPVAFSGVRSWWGYSAVAISVAATVAIARAISRMDRPTQAAGLLLALTSFTAIACTSGFYGTLVLVPLLVTANVLFLSAGLEHRYRGWVLFMGFCSMLVPFALERVGVLPESYRYEPGSVTVLPVVRDLHEAPVRMGLILSSLAALIAPTLFTWRISSRATTARERMHVYGWQLRRLLPKDAYSGVSEFAEFSRVEKER